MELSNAELIELLTTPFYRPELSPADFGNEDQKSAELFPFYFAISQTQGSSELQRVHQTKERNIMLILIYVVATVFGIHALACN